MNIAEIRNIVQAARKAVFFGGAGVSTESRIPDFRSASGLYRTAQGTAYPPEVMLSRPFFDTHPEEFYAFYRAKMLHPGAKPNDAHQALAKLEREGRLAAVVTQNIDGLHQAAGSSRVLELHGSVHRNFCTSCGRSHDLAYVLESGPGVPACTACGGTVKPDVVLYGENLDPGVLEAAVQAIAEADVLIVGGTSLTVNPAASLIRHYSGNRLILLNREATPYDDRAQYIVRDSIGGVLRLLTEGE
ncbi:NAD-dependent protein deacylase [Paenibacillus aurantius]|uniref:NAD-dependent protein deacetylase n=1 Tax=Paenibacillus aurantius TaxID=2918900 RepID=A0AA96RHL6_9BACL|nr:NAD-dependent protein deacylase [Paenibacillus aurantius]WNQ14157.1 NAD-dependent protein deacylase [Paenibacillus aurantius]